MNILSKFQLSSSSGLGFEYISTNHHLGNHEAACGTAPATPGLLITSETAKGCHRALQTVT